MVLGVVGRHPFDLVDAVGREERGSAEHEAGAGRALLVCGGSRGRQAGCGRRPSSRRSRNRPRPWSWRWRRGRGAPTAAVRDTADRTPPPDIASSLPTKTDGATPRPALKGFRSGDHATYAIRIQLGYTSVLAPANVIQQVVRGEYSRILRWSTAAEPLGTLGRERKFSLVGQFRPRRVSAPLPGWSPSRQMDALLTVGSRSSAARRAVAIGRLPRRLTYSAVVAVLVWPTCRAMSARSTPPSA